jgi:hypothetical protein
VPYLESLWATLKLFYDRAIQLSKCQNSIIIMALLRSSAEAVGALEKGWLVTFGHFGISAFCAITRMVVGNFKKLL